MEHEMRKYIDTFKQKLTESENLNISDVRQRSVYLLTNDGHRDSVNLQHCAMDGWVIGLYKKDFEDFIFVNGQTLPLKKFELDLNRIER